MRQPEHLILAAMLSMSIHAHTVGNGFDASSVTQRPMPGTSYNLEHASSNVSNQSHALESAAALHDDSLMLTLQLTLIHWTPHCTSSTVPVTL